MNDPFPAHADAASLFTASLAEADPEIADAVGRELGRQRDEIELIASENIVSKAVLEAQGSVLTNKYAEGCRDGATTAAANMSTWPKPLRSNGLPSFSDVNSQTFSRIPARPPTSPPSWR